MQKSRRFFERIRKLSGGKLKTLVRLKKEVGQIGAKISPPFNVFLCSCDQDRDQFSVVMLVVASISSIT